MIRTEVMQYLLTQISALTVIQKRVRGFLKHRRYMLRAKRLNNSARIITDFFCILHGTKMLRRLKAQQVSE